MRKHTRRGRYRVSRHVETQYQPGSDRRVLRNLLDIRSAREMARVEQRELIRTTEWLAQTYGRDRQITVADLRDLHRRWLGGIYEWAGEFREVNVSKGGFLFAAAGLIPRLMEEFEKRYLARYTPVRADSECDVALVLAETHTELLLIHPFREGNGRLARLLAIAMAWQAGLPTPAFETMVRRRKPEYFAAVRTALDRNYAPMRAIFASIIYGEGR